MVAESANFFSQIALSGATIRCVFARIVKVELLASRLFNFKYPGPIEHEQGDLTLEIEKATSQRTT